MHNILIGCDPEVFVATRTTGEPFSAHGLVNGTKEKPFEVPDGAVQVDGMALEFNTDPSSTREGFVRRVTSVYKTLDSMLPPNLTLLPGVPVVHFSPEIFSAQPQEALELGCEPDFNAYTKEFNPRPDPNGDTLRMRTAAGHIHIGIYDLFDGPPPNHFEACVELTKLMDVFVGVDSLSFDPDVERRSLYGQAGAFRSKPYGVEYRVLSNKWIVSPELIGRVYDLTIKTVKMYQDGVFLPPLFFQEAQHIINTSQTREAEKFLTKVDQFLKESGQKHG